MRICLVGDSQDLTATYIGWLADRRGVDVVRLEEASLGIDWAFSFDDLKSHSGSIETSGRTLAVSEISGVFVRLNPDPGVASELRLDSDEIGALSVERRHALHFLLNTLSCAVVNRPYSGRSNGSKPHQMRLLEDAGFVVPKWLVSNDNGAVLEFVRQCEHPPIVKSCSGLRSKVRLFDSVVTERLQDGTSPVVVQEYIGGFDVRAHVVDGRVFSTKISSKGIDYRFDSEDNKFDPIVTPPKIEELCKGYARLERLILAGFDFRVSGDGVWYCLEVNPVPTFLPYEMATGQSIGESVLDVLVRGTGQC